MKLKILIATLIVCLSPLHILSTHGARRTGGRQHQAGHSARHTSKGRHGQQNTHHRKNHRNHDKHDGHRNRSGHNHGQYTRNRGTNVRRDTTVGNSINTRVGAVGSVGRTAILTAPLALAATQALRSTAAPVVVNPVVETQVAPAGLTTSNSEEEDEDTDDSSLEHYEA